MEKRRFRIELFEFRLKLRVPWIRLDLGKVNNTGDPSVVTIRSERVVGSDFVDLYLPFFIIITDAWRYNL